MINKIIMVKKINLDGTPCRKCKEIEERIQRDGYQDKIDLVIIADEGDLRSEGMILAKEYGIDRAPFFIVEDDDGATTVYTVYLKFVKEVLKGKISHVDEVNDLLDNVSEVDYL